VTRSQTGILKRGAKEHIIPLLILSPLKSSISAFFQDFSLQGQKKLLMF
jgi:hypothetical protein